MKNRDLILNGVVDSNQYQIAEILLDIRELLLLIREEISVIRKNTRKEAVTGIVIPKRE